MTLITFALAIGMLLGAGLGVLGVIMCVSIDGRVNKLKRKRKLTSYQVHQHGADWMREYDKQLGILPRDKPLDTSWGNMSEEEEARLECAKREYRIPMDFSSSSRP